jgi:riboflavin synthase
MFTGIVTDVGEVLKVAPRVVGTRFRIATAYDPQTIEIGASIACSGCCLTAVERGIDGNRAYFDVEASPETLSRTTLGGWSQGTRLNLERSLKLGDELGGHMVSGHVDGLATIVARRDDGDMATFTFEVPEELARFVAEKGSVALDGTSLTVNRVEGRRFDVALIPHTLAVTTWGARETGDTVNLEVDQVARYVARLSEQV